MSDLVWVEVTTYEILGTVFRIQNQDSTIVARVEHLLGPFPHRAVRVRPSNTFSLVGFNGGLRLYRDCHRLLGDALKEPVFVRMIAEINQTAVMGCTEFAVHAAVVGTNDRVLAIIAPSAGGKSTLAAALSLRGLDYGSDEALVIGEEGLVRPYPKPLALSPWSLDALGISADLITAETLFAPQDLGADVLGVERKLTDVIIAEPPADEPLLESLPASAAMSALIEYSFNHYKNPRRAFDLTARLSRSVLAWRLRLGPPNETADLIMHRLGLPARDSR